MNWHHPDLYFFLFLLTGLATFLVIIYECIRTFRRKPPVLEPSRSTVGNPPSASEQPPSLHKYLNKAKPLDGLLRDRPRRAEERASGRPSDFNRLCESDLTPEEQASRLREYFGILGGARPAEGRRRFTPGEVQRLEQRSRMRL
jgi:hypothetical protein